jgi:hypothetical protein
MVIRANINLGAIRSAGRKVGGASFLKNLDQQLYLSREKEKERAFDLAEKEKDRSILRAKNKLAQDTKALTDMRSVLSNMAKVRDANFDEMFPLALAAGMTEREFNIYKSQGVDETQKLYRNDWKDTIVPLFENTDPMNADYKQIFPDLEKEGSRNYKIFTSMGYTPTYTVAKNQHQVMYNKHLNVDNPAHRDSGMFINNFEDISGKKHRILISHKDSVRKTLNEKQSNVLIAKRYLDYASEIDQYFSNITGLAPNQQIRLQNKLSTLMSEIPLTKGGATISIGAQKFAQAMPNLQKVLGDNSSEFFNKINTLEPDGAQVNYNPTDLNSGSKKSPIQKRTEISLTSLANKSALSKDAKTNNDIATGLNLIVPDVNQRSTHPKYELAVQANVLFKKMLKDKTPEDAKAFFQFMEKNFDENELPNMRKALTQAVLTTIPLKIAVGGEFNKQNNNEDVQNLASKDFMKLSEYKKASEKSKVYTTLIRDLKQIQKITTKVDAVTGTVPEMGTDLVSFIKEIQNVGSAIAGVTDVLSGNASKTTSYFAEKSKEFSGGFTSKNLQGNVDFAANAKSTQLFKIAESHLQGDLEQTESLIKRFEDIAQNQRTPAENLALQKYRLQKLLIYKKMAITYQLSGMLQGSEGGGRTISNQDFDIAMRSLWGNQDGLTYKLENVIDSAENRLADAENVMSVGKLGSVVLKKVSDASTLYSNYKSDKLIDGQLKDITAYSRIPLEQQTRKYRAYIAYKTADSKGKKLLHNYRETATQALKTTGFNLANIPRDAQTKKLKISTVTDFEPAAQEAYNDAWKVTLGSFYISELERTGVLKSSDTPKYKSAFGVSKNNRSDAEKKLVRKFEQMQLNYFNGDARQLNEFEDTVKKEVLRSILAPFRENQ